MQYYCLRALVLLQTCSVTVLIAHRYCETCKIVVGGLHGYCNTLCCLAGLRLLQHFVLFCGLQCLCKTCRIIVFAGFKIIATLCVVSGLQGLCKGCKIIVQRASGLLTRFALFSWHWILFGSASRQLPRCPLLGSCIPLHRCSFFLFPGLIDFGCFLCIYCNTVFLLFLCTILFFIYNPIYCF